jgi:hypothetical protein
LGDGGARGPRLCAEAATDLYELRASLRAPAPGRTSVPLRSLTAVYAGTG